MIRPRRLALPLGIVSLLGVGCALPPGLLIPGDMEPLRISRTLDEGDAARRASSRIVIEGLDADSDARPDVALRLYERSLQVDPTNPWAYLALARHRADGAAPELALPALDQAEVLARGRSAHAPGAEAHFVGLRGAVLLGVGRREQGLAFLRRARELAPAVWSDGRLEAWELR